MSIRYILALCALATGFVLFGVHEVDKAHALPKDCLVLKVPPAGVSNYKIANPLSLPYCGYQDDYYVGQKPLKRSDFLASCDRGQKPIDIYMGWLGNLQWRCVPSGSPLVVRYRQQYADIISGRVNPNLAPMMMYPYLRLGKVHWVNTALDKHGKIIKINP